MNLSVIAGPCIGALIGYCTNYIAVKMLFRPLHPVKIGTYTLPFTPGIIPKGKSRLAGALGRAVGNMLLTEEDFKKVLLSEEMLAGIDHTVERFYEEEDQRSIREYCCLFTEEEEYLKGKEKAGAAIAKHLISCAEKIDFQQLIADKGVSAVRSHLDGLLAMMISDDMIRSVAKPIGKGIEKYISEEGEGVLLPLVDEELTKTEEKTPVELAEKIEIDCELAKKIVRSIYVEFVHRRFPDLIRKIDISSMIESKINEMDVLQIEELMLSIMKKELHAVVNLGAVIGFVIGLLNILI